MKFTGVRSLLACVGLFRRIMKYILILCFIFTASCATMNRTTNKMIDTTIDDLTKIETRTEAEKSAVKRAVIQLEQAKDINDENDSLKKQIKSDAKYVKTGKLAIAGFILFGVIAVGLFVFKIVR